MGKPRGADINRTVALMRKYDYSDKVIKNLVEYYTIDR